jgi:arylsulfatase A-like enzyme
LDRFRDIQMHNRQALHLLAAALLAAVTIVFALTRASAADPAPPNIVVFLVDGMGVMDTSVPFLTDAAGKPKRYPLNDYYRMPNMARLAERGIRFNNFYAMSVCSPTRVSLMTGQNAARHRTTNWINPARDNRGPSGPPEWNWKGLSGDCVTLPRLRQKVGYRTIHVGKGHFGSSGNAGANVAMAAENVEALHGMGRWSGRVLLWNGAHEEPGMIESDHSPGGSTTQVIFKYSPRSFRDHGSFGLSSVFPSSVERG